MHLFSNPSGWRWGGRHGHKVDALWRWRRRLLQIVVTLRTVVQTSYHFGYSSSNLWTLSNHFAWKHHTGFGNKLQTCRQVNSAAPQCTGNTGEQRDAKFTVKLVVIQHKSGKWEGISQCWSIILPTQPVLERLVALLTPEVLIWHVCIRPLHNKREDSDDHGSQTCWKVQQGSK